MADFHSAGAIAKRDDDLRVVYGWASVIEEAGQPVIDTQGDVIEEAELLKAAHGFVTEARVGGFMHAVRDGQPVQVGEVVESVVLTKSMQEALGVDLGRVGWWIGIRITDDRVWKAVKDGRLAGFSIGGRGTRTPVDVDLED